MERIAHMSHMHSSSIFRRAFGSTEQKNKTKKREEREMPAGCFEGKKGKKIKNLNETRPPPHETDIKTLKKLSDDD